MAIRYDHVQLATSSAMIANATTTDTVTKASATLSNEVIYRSYINCGFNATLEWIEASLSVSVYAPVSVAEATATVTGKWQIRCRGEAGFTDLVSIVAPPATNGVIGYRPSSTASGGGLNSVTYTGAGWTINEWTGLYFVCTSGTGSGTNGAIVSNTADTLTLATGGTYNNTSVFYIGGSSTYGTKTFTADVSYDSVAATNTAPFELQLIASTDAAIATVWTFGSTTLTTRSIGESV